MNAVVRAGDTATGHTDIEGISVTGIVELATSSNNLKNGNIGIATSTTYVNFPSHAHALNEGTPIDFRTHRVLITATGKHKNGGNNIVVNGDTVNVSDEAGGDANCVATTTNLNCSI